MICPLGMTAPTERGRVVLLGRSTMHPPVAKLLILGTAALVGAAWLYLKKKTSNTISTQPR